MQRLKLSLFSHLKPQSGSVLLPMLLLAAGQAAASTPAASLPPPTQEIPVLPVQRNPEPELQLHTPTIPVRNSEPLAETRSTDNEHLIQVDADTLLAQPELLVQAMHSALAAQNIAGIKALLPIYQQWPQHEAATARYAAAQIAQHEGRAAEAVRLYREMIAAEPEAAPVRYQLAQALFADQQNEAAADQFRRLSSEDLPPEVRSDIDLYQEALRKRDAFQFQAGFSLAHESNINQAPKARRMGSYLSEQACAIAREDDPGDDCFRGWQFEQPIDATALQYQLGAGKKWSLPDGFYLRTDLDNYGKAYHQQRKYNDHISRLTVSLGYANQNNDLSLSPYHERRLYGNRAYSYTNGLRLNLNRFWSRNVQTLHAADYSQQTLTQYQERPQSALLSSAVVFYPNASQYWLAGADWYREFNRHNNSDNFNRYGIRAEWMQEWPGGLSSRLQLAHAQRRHQEAGIESEWFANGEKRHDRENNASLSLWHRAIHFYGITPRFTVGHTRNDSNSVLNEYRRTRAFFEMNRTF